MSNSRSLDSTSVGVGKPPPHEWPGQAPELHWIFLFTIFDKT